MRNTSNINKTIIEIVPSHFGHTICRRHGDGNVIMDKVGVALSMGACSVITKKVVSVSLATKCIGNIELALIEYTQTYK